MRMDTSDALVLVGLILSGAGIWMIYPPASLVAVGLVVLLIGIALAKSKGGEKK